MRDAADLGIVAARHRFENRVDVGAFVRQKTRNQIAQILVHFHYYSIRHGSSLRSVASVPQSSNRFPSIASRITSSSVDFFTGLVICASHPAALVRRTASSRADAVSAT